MLLPAAAVLPADLVARAGQLGEEGDVDGAMAATQQAETLGKQHETLYKQLTEPERTMTVCDICGVFINSTDNEQRRMVSGGDHGGGGRAAPARTVCALKVRVTGWRSGAAADGQRCGTGGVQAASAVPAGSGFHSGMRSLIRPSRVKVRPWLGYHTVFHTGPSEVDGCCAATAVCVSLSLSVHAGRCVALALAGA